MYGGSGDGGLDSGFGGGDGGSGWWRSGREVVVEKEEREEDLVVVGGDEIDGVMELEGGDVEVRGEKGGEMGSGGS